MKVVLLLGSNLGDSLNYLSRAEGLLSERIGMVVDSSRVEQSEAWGFMSDMVFFNQVIVCRTELPPREVLDICEDVERMLGRVKDLSVDWRAQRKYVDRVIDIDILYYLDGENCSVSYEDERLQIPHAKISERDFVKVLLDELNLF